MATIAELLERNRALAKDHKELPFISEFASISLDFPHTLIITCADPRCHPERYFGLTSTDGVVVVRNAGGHVTPEITSILALDHLLTINNILVIHHTDCGALLFTDEQVKENLKKRLPQDLAANVNEMVFGGITDIEQSVIDDLAALRSSPYVRKAAADSATGYIFDIKTGLLTQVAA